MNKSCFMCLKIVFSKHNFKLDKKNGDKNRDLVAMVIKIVIWLNDFLKAVLIILKKIFEL